MESNPSNQSNQSKRLVQSHEMTIPATADRIFPLLCPVLEYEWIEGWKCDLLRSESGVAENNCIFRTNDPLEGEMTWVVSRYEPDRDIEFVIFRPELLVLKLDLGLSENGNGTTRLRITHTFTGVGEEGNAVVGMLPEDFTRERWNWLGEALAYYLRTGEMLRRGGEGRPHFVDN